MSLIEIFYSPGKVFEAQREKPNWWLPMLLCVALSLLSTVMVMNMVGMGTIVRNQLEQSAAGRQMSPEQLDKVVAASETSKLQKTIAYVAAPVTSVIALVVVAGILMGLLQMTSAGARFPQVLAVVGFSWWAYSVVALILAFIVLKSMPDYAGVDFQNLVVLNLSPLLDKATASKPLYRLVASFDLLTFYAIFLMGLGLSTVSARLTLKKGILLVAIPWLVYVGIKVGLAAIF